MSLHTLANHLQTAGRGEDKVLVHMTPGEVSGLQSLAMAHGGSLTINPHTGLPEAGFLSAILPMIAGAALAATGVGAPMAALMVGGAGAAMTGSLSKGLMMGLGAYGGAGLGAGLMGGAEAAGALGSANAIAAQNAANMGAQATSTFGNTMGSGMVGGAATGAVANQVPIGLQSATGTGAYAPGAQLPGQPQPTVFGGTAQPATPVVASNSINPTTGLPAGAPSVESATAFDRFKSLPGKAYDLLSGSGPEADKAREDFLKQNKNYLLTGGLSALAMSRETPKPPSQPHYKVNQYDWNREFNPSAREPGSSAERTYFADGGLASLPVEQMSQQNALMDNPKYPMAYQNTPQYSTHTQNPIPQNVVYPATDDNTNPYNGEERSMATGGSTSGSIKNSAASYGLKEPRITPMGGQATGSTWAELEKVAKELGINTNQFTVNKTVYVNGVKTTQVTHALPSLYAAIDNAAKAQTTATISSGAGNTATSNATTSNAATISTGAKANTVTSNVATSNAAIVSSGTGNTAKANATTSNAVTTSTANTATSNAATISTGAKANATTSNAVTTSTANTATSKNSAASYGLEEPGTSPMGGQATGSTWAELEKVAKELGINTDQFTTNKTVYVNGVKTTQVVHALPSLYYAIDNAAKSQTTATISSGAGNTATSNATTSNAVTTSTANTATSNAATISTGAKANTVTSNVATGNVAAVSTGATTNAATSNAATTGVASLTAAQKVAKELLDKEKTWANTGIKTIDLNTVAAPSNGFTAKNTVSTYESLLKKQKNQLDSVESRIQNIIDSKTKTVKKPEQQDAYDYLQGLLKDQQAKLTSAVNTVYEKIPKTNVDFSNPKKAIDQKTNQQNEYDAVNNLLTNYINASSLKATDYAADFIKKVSAENAQKQESTLYADKIAPALAKLAEYTGKDSKGNDITGGLSALTTGWNDEKKRQSDDVTSLKSALVNAGLMDNSGNWTVAANQYTGLTNLAKSALQKQQDEVTTATTAKDKALQDFSTATARGESIGTRGISAIKGNTTSTTTGTTIGGLGGSANNTVTVSTASGPVKYVIQPNGTWAPEKPTPQYQKLEYGTVNATTGWDDTTKKPYEPEDVQKVFQEVVGRKATASELTDYVGVKGTIQALVDKVDASPDISITRGQTNPFTESELQANAKYYWGREMTAGELASYKNANILNFRKLRNTLTNDNKYVDYLNKLNQEQFTKENTPTPIGANPNEISSAFSDILYRKPTSAELQDYLSKKTSVSDLKTQLKNSNEYISRLVSDPKNLTTAIAALASTQVQNLSSQVINNLSSSQINAIKTSNIAALTTDQVQNLSSQVINNLSSSQINAIKTSNIAALTSDQVQNLSSQVINQLTSNQLQAITTTNIAALNTNQVQNLSSQTVNQLTSNQVQALTTSNVTQLNTGQVQAIATTGLGTLATNQVQAITTTNIAPLNTTQIQNIATTGIATLTSQQVQPVSTTGIAALTTNQIQNLTSQSVNNLATSQVQPLAPLPPPAITEVGRNDILPPPVTMTRQQMEDYGRLYSSFKPTSPGLYTPQVPPNPLASIEGALPYRDVNKSLGLTGLYEQMARATPPIQSGMNFTPNQAVAQASPFANTNPGMVTLQSIAPPNAQSDGSLLSPQERALLGYAQAQSIIPGSQTNIASLTPEQQLYLSSAQVQPRNLAMGGYAGGGYHLGDYSDGGRLLKGPGDGVSDSIPASIGNKQPARLADGEFVIPARIVSEIGNGSTDAGARRLYEMMERIQQARNKTVGHGKVAVKSGADRMLPA